MSNKEQCFPQCKVKPRTERELPSNQVVVSGMFAGSFRMTVVCFSCQCQEIWAVTRTMESHHPWLAPARHPTNSQSKRASAPAAVSSSRWFLWHTFTKCLQRQKWQRAQISVSYFSSSPLFLTFGRSEVALPSPVSASRGIWTNDYWLTPGERMVAYCSCECQGALHSSFPPSLKQHPDSPNKNSLWWFLWLITLLQNTQILLPAFLLKQLPAVIPSNTIPPFLMHLCCQSLQAWNQVMLVSVEIILTTGDTGRQPARNATVFALETTLSPVVGMAESFFLTVSIEAGCFPQRTGKLAKRLKNKENCCTPNSKTPPFSIK